MSVPRAMPCVAESFSQDAEDEMRQLSGPVPVFTIPRLLALFTTGGTATRFIWPVESFRFGEPMTAFRFTLATVGSVWVGAGAAISIPAQSWLTEQAFQAAR